jgi:trehalose 6-phosphate phosphatase
MVKTQTEDIAAAWRESPVSAIPKHELMLVTDFDGTLAEIGPDPTRSAALPEAINALRRLATTLKRVVVLSSRTTDELQQMVTLRGVQLIGDSGLRMPGPGEKQKLEFFNSQAAKSLADVPGVWLEIKPASTTIHLRNSPATSTEILERLAPILDATGLDASPGRKVIEVHVAHAGKGNALTALLEEVRPTGLIALGDDENDRSLFTVACSQSIPHLCVGVASAEVSPDLFERCDVVVSGPGDVAALLRVIAEAADS